MNYFGFFLGILTLVIYKKIKLGYGMNGQMKRET
jgi:hypothetical protein